MYFLDEGCLDWRSLMCRFSKYLLVLGNDDNSVGVEIAENGSSLYCTCDPLGGGGKEKVT